MQVCGFEASGNFFNFMRVKLLSYRNSFESLTSYSFHYGYEQGIKGHENELEDCYLYICTVKLSAGSMLPSKIIS